MTDHLVVVNSAVEAEEAPPVLCVARLATKKFRDMNKKSGKRYHTEEDIRKAQGGSKSRAGFGSGGGGGATAR